jgi:hypothetical protein
VDQSATRSTNSAPGDIAGPLGRTEPRIFTPPLRELTPETSYGHDVVEFARDVLGEPLDAWQEWLVIHAGELLPDGRPRFRQVLALVSRQNGKTHLLKVLALYWLFVEQHRTVLGMSTNLTTAKEAWRGAIAMAQGSEWLAPEILTVKLANGDEALVTTSDCRYKIAASNARGGRGLTVNRLVVDELREHQTWDAYNAAIPAMNAVFDGQAWFITNQGEDKSVVLDALRGSAIEHVNHGGIDDRLGIFEWSAPDGADPEDPEALAMANPALGRRIDPTALLGMARRAKAAGGTELAGFRTEQMCQRVHLLDPAVEPDAWRDAGTDAPLSLAQHRNRVALCVDIALDGSHASVVACAVIGGQAHAEVVGSWSGMGCSQVVRAELPGLVRRVKPRLIGWFPNGPAAQLAADLERRKGRADGWPPPGVKVEELRGELTAVCMGLAEQVRTGHVTHPRDPMLDQHVAASSKQWRGDAWVFQRAGAGPIDGTYALAGALHLARTMRVFQPITGGVV